MKIENVSIYNLYPAIVAIRNATRTWNKSDTKQVHFKCTKQFNSYNHAVIGPTDKDLINKLLASSRSSGRANYRKFLRQILVTFDLTAPKSFWSVFDSYKIGVTTNNSNTMPVLKRVVAGIQKLEISHFEYKTNKESKSLSKLISELNSTKDINLITTLLPQSFLLRKSWSGSYENLLNIYHDQNKNKFYQWKIIIKMIKNMPYMKDLLLPNGV